MDKVKDMAILVIVMIILGTIVGCAGKTETESVRCCVTATETVNSDMYLITVESSKDHELWSYYDDVPRQKGSVIICEFSNGNEIINIHEGGN